MSKKERVHALVKKHVEIERKPADQRDEVVARLERPWIGHEGPLSAYFFQAKEPCDLLPRGIAFAGETTVLWDEAGVRVLRMVEGEEEDWLAVETDVHVRERFRADLKLKRVDFLHNGSYQGSHYRLAKEGSYA